MYPAGIIVVVLIRGFRKPLKIGLNVGVGLFVPVVVQRPLMTPKTRCPLPLVAATRATSSGQEGIPHGPASLEERLGAAHWIATPATRSHGTPGAQRTSDSAER